MEKYTVVAIGNDGGMNKISVMATVHRQHIWNETNLVGVSAAGIKKLDAFFKAHEGDRITVDAGVYNPRLVSYKD